jgi:hypothetical protein
MGAGCSARRRAGLLDACFLQLGLAGCEGARAQALPLTTVKDIALGAPTRRFDYASIDPKAGLLFFADLAGGRAVDPTTHAVFLPLRNVGGKAVLRILQPK